MWHSPFGTIGVTTASEAIALINEVDVDSIVQTFTLAKLLTMFSMSVVELLNTPQVVKDVGGAVCLGRMGFRLFVYMNEQQRTLVCDYSCQQGLLVISYASPMILCKGSTNVELHMLARALEEADVG